MTLSEPEKSRVEAAAKKYTLRFDGHDKFGTSNTGDAMFEKKAFLAGAEFLAGLRAEAGDDERDAREWADNNKGCFPTNSMNRYEGFLAGLKRGRERAKQEFSGYLKIDVENEVAEAVKSAEIAERERILKYIKQVGQDWRKDGDVLKDYAAEYLHTSIDEWLPPHGKFLTPAPKETTE